MSPSRAPPGDAISRCRDAVDSIQAATSHKYARDRAELVHLLGSPHIQVSKNLLNLSNPIKSSSNDIIKLRFENMLRASTCRPID